MNEQNIIITGHWGGEPIWRYKTVQEELLAILFKSEQDRKQYPQGFISEQEAEIYENNKN